jgi:hypothetical protein
VHKRAVQLLKVMPQEVPMVLLLVAMPLTT